jgi:hypothetical protein
MRLGWPRFFPLSLPLPPDAPPDSEVSQQDPLPGSALPLCSPITSAGVLPAPAFGQHFSVLIVMLALRLFFEASFRFRVVGQTLRVLAEVGASPLPMPCFHSVRLWVLRIGLYRLQNPCLGPRWALICDHTATYSGLKLFVIC